MSFICVAVRSVGRITVALLLSGCSLSVLEGLTGGGESDGGSPSGPLVPPSDAAGDTSVLDTSMIDASGGRPDAGADRLADASMAKDESNGAASDADAADDVEDEDGGAPPDAGTSDASPGYSDSADADATSTDIESDGDGLSPCGCVGDGYCMGTECVYPTCQARLQAMPGSPSGITWIDPDGEGAAGQPAFRTYCEMVADGGGWTLVLKVSGTDTTFLNRSSLWENEVTYRPEYPDLDANEAKLASYNGVAFSNVRVGMLQSGTTRWLVIPMAARSFLDLMRTGYQPTTLGRAAWKSLPASGSLQTFCGREGFNVTTPAQAAVRIGIIGNELDNCTSCDSWIGFGGELMGLGYACGNVARWQPDNGDRDLRLFGYVMVR